MHLNCWGRLYWVVSWQLIGMGKSQGASSSKSQRCTPLLTWQIHNLVASGASFSIKAISTIGVLSSVRNLLYKLTFFKVQQTVSSVAVSHPIGRLADIVFYCEFSILTWHLQKVFIYEIIYMDLIYLNNKIFNFCVILNLFTWMTYLYIFSIL